MSCPANHERKEVTTLGCAAAGFEPGRRIPATQFTRNVSRIETGVITIFDRYLVRSFLSVFGILFATVYGLFVVIDGFTNIDAFQEGQTSTVDVLMATVTYYAYQSAPFFDMVASILSVVSTMVTFALLQRHAELHSLLAAGVPTYRLVVPAIAATLLVNVAIAVNQELIIPRISHHIQAATRSQSKGDTQKIEAIHDYETGILIGGAALRLRKRAIEQPRFVLPVPGICEIPTPLEGNSATFHKKSDRSPSGWLLKDVTHPLQQLRLTPEGKKRIRATQTPGEIFVVTDVSFDQLCSRSRSFKLVSTPELVRRINNPAYSSVSLKGQSLELHVRLLRPLIDVVTMLIAIPLIVRKESRGLVGSMAICTGVLGILYAVLQGSLYIGSINLIAADLAVWLPVILIGTLAAWLASLIQT